MGCRSPIQKYIFLLQGKSFNTTFFMFVFQYNPTISAHSKTFLSSSLKWTKKSWDCVDIGTLRLSNKGGGGHTGLRSQTLSGKLKVIFLMSDLIFWCRTALNKKDQVAPKLLVHFSSSSWEISVPPITNNYGWNWCVIVWLLTWKLRVKWISRVGKLSKTSFWEGVKNEKAV